MSTGEGEVEDNGLSIKSCTACRATKNADRRVGDILVKSTWLGMKVVVSPKRYELFRGELSPGRTKRGRVLVVLHGGDGDRRKETLFLVARRPFFSDDGGRIFVDWRLLINGGDGD